MTHAIFSNKAQTAIELTLQDNQERQKKAVLLFDIEDNWFGENASHNDVIGFFASAMMQAVEKDNTAVLFQAQQYKIENGSIQKGWTFSPMVKQEGVFKSAFISADGRVEFL